MGGIRTWTLLVSAAVHLAILLALIDWQDDQGATATGLGGLEVALGPAGGATTSPVAPDMPQVEEAQPPTPVETVETPAPAEPVDTPPPVEMVETTDPPTPDVPPPVEAGPVTEPVPAEPPPVAEPDTPPLITATAVDPIETVAMAPPEIQPPPTAEPVTAETLESELAPVEPRPVERETVRAREPAVTPPPPPPRPRRDPPPRPTSVRTAAAVPTPQAAQPAPAQATVAAARPSADPGPPAPTRGTPGAAQGADADRDPGGGTPGPSPDYLGRLRAWLERHKEYPDPSRTRREEGTVWLRFVMERSGRVLSHRIERSSGHPALDRAVEEMLSRAAPLPAMPPDMRQGRLELVVPVQFALR